MQGMRGANRVRSELCPKSRQEFLHASWPTREWRHAILFSPAWMNFEIDPQGRNALAI